MRQTLKDVREDHAQTTVTQGTRLVPAVIRVTRLRQLHQPGTQVLLLLLRSSAHRAVRLLTETRDAPEQL